MDIQKIKELALANGFKLKEQASGNMDLHSYVYEFAQAVAVEIINQSQLVFGQDGVTVFDTETLDSEISNISSEFEAEYFFDNDDADRLELLVAKAMKLGELYERQKWQQAQKVAVPENTKTVYLVWNKSHSECVGFDDKQDAKYASTGRQTSLSYSSLAGEFREVYEDEIGEGNFDITEIKIQSQEPSHD